MKKEMRLLTVAAFSAVVAACSSGPKPEAETPAAAPAVAETAAVSDIPASYKDIRYPDYKYVAPYPKDYRVELAPGISGYIVPDSSLPLVNLSVYFENPQVVSNIKDEAASEMLGSMFRRGGSTNTSAHAPAPPGRARSARGSSAGSAAFSPGRSKPASPRRTSASTPVSASA